MLAEHPKLKSAQLKKIKDPRKPLKKGRQENFADSAPTHTLPGLCIEWDRIRQVEMLGAPSFCSNERRF